MAAKYNLVKLVLGIYWALYCFFNMISAMQSTEFRNKHFWYLSNWGLYISTAYLLVSAIVGTFQYGYLLRSDSELHQEEDAGVELTASPTAGASATPVAIGSSAEVAPHELLSAMPTPDDATDADGADSGEVQVAQASVPTEGAQETEETDASAGTPPHSTVTEPQQDSSAVHTSMPQDAAESTGAIEGDAVLSTVPASLTGSEDDAPISPEGATTPPQPEQAQEPGQGATAPQLPAAPGKSDSVKANDVQQPVVVLDDDDLPLEPPLTSEAAWPSCRASCTVQTATQPSVLPTMSLFSHCNPTPSFWVHATVVFLLELAFALGVGITLIYWTLLFDPDDAELQTDLYRSVQTHMSLVIPVVECMLSRVPFSSTHFPAMVGVGLFYVFVNAMYTVGNPGESLYSILKWDSAGGSIAVVVGVLLLAIIAFWGGRACTRTRDLLAARHLVKGQHK